MLKPRLAVVACLGALAACSNGTGPSPVSQGGGSSSQDTLVYAGTFHPVSATGQGMAQVYRLPGGARELRFTSTFSTEINPNVEVWLVAAPDAQDNATVLDSAHVSLGPLQSGTGGQSYMVPDSVSFTTYRSVSIWCVKAQVNFTTAPLTPQ